MTDPARLLVGFVGRFDAAEGAGQYEQRTVLQPHVESTLQRVSDGD